MPGFHALLDAIAREFGAMVTTEMLDEPLTRSFRSQRNQYDAEVFLKELAPLVSHHAEKSVFITREDLFAHGLNFVFGFAKGKNSIVSLARLDPRFYGPVQDAAAANALFKERIQKEVMHELGHASGLAHCGGRACAMSFSNSLAEVDWKGLAFCESCRNTLKKPSQANLSKGP